LFSLCSILFRFGGFVFFVVCVLFFVLSLSVCFHSVLVLFLLLLCGAFVPVMVVVTCGVVCWFLWVPCPVFYFWCVLVVFGVGLITVRVSLFVCFFAFLCR